MDYWNRAVYWFLATSSGQISSNQTSFAEHLPVGFHESTICHQLKRQCQVKKMSVYLSHREESCSLPGTESRSLPKLGLDDSLENWHTYREQDDLSVWQIGWGRFPFICYLCKCGKCWGMTKLTMRICHRSIRMVRKVRRWELPYPSKPNCWHNYPGFLPRLLVALSEGEKLAHLIHSNRITTSHI